MTLAFVHSQEKLYLLLLGTTALSLLYVQLGCHLFVLCNATCKETYWYMLLWCFVQVTTPLLFKFIPIIMQLGIVMGWFSSDTLPTEVKFWHVLV